MIGDRLAFGLKHLEPSSWRLFEVLCGGFLAEESDLFRSRAAPSGDGGLDGLLIAPEDESVGYQFSVAADWQGKIRQTARRVSETWPRITQLVFMSNQEIAASGDEIRAAVKEEYGIWLDIRDRQWFVDRASTSTARQDAAETFASKVVDPLLPTRMQSEMGKSITSDEGRVALVHLAFSDHDRKTERSLTKSSFDALVLAVLRESDSENRLGRAQIQEAVAHLVPMASRQQVDDLTSSALVRLSGKNGKVKWHKSDDTFHLSFAAASVLRDERERWTLSSLEMADEVRDEIARLDVELSDEEVLESVEAVLRTLDQVMWQRGEEFAAAVLQGTPLAPFDTSGLSDSVEGLAVAAPPRLGHDHLVQILISLLRSESEATRAYLTRLADGYTLMAFLQQTADVQKTLSKVFDGGELWIDTSVVLPLLCERFTADIARTPYTDLFACAIKSGIRVLVTDGVIEEVATHLERGLHCARSFGVSRWNGDPPFVIREFVAAGRAIGEYASWLDTVCGNADPEADIEEYLRYHYGILRAEPTAPGGLATPEAVDAIQEFWDACHTSRRQGRQDVMNVSRLVAHDVDAVVGVLTRRRKRGSDLGYEAWWLTLDGQAFRLADHLNDVLGRDAPASPVMSPQFLAQLLRFGPLRSDAGTAEATSLSLGLDLIGSSEVSELLEVAQRIRQQYADYDELRIRREVRDGLNRSRSGVSESQELEAGIFGETRR